MLLRINKGQKVVFLLNTGLHVATSFCYQQPLAARVT